MFFIGRPIDLLDDLRLHDMKNRQFKGDAGERSRPSRVPVNNGFRVKFRAIGIRGSDDDDKVLLVVFIHNLFNAFLTFQVNTTGGGSDKALGLDE